MFKSVLEEDNVSCTTKWDDLRSIYKNNQYFKDLHPYDRITTFVEYIFEAEKRYEEDSKK